MWRWLIIKVFTSMISFYKTLRTEAMNTAKSYIEKLETEGVYLSNIHGDNQFIPWQSISQFTLNTHEKRYNAIIKYKEGKEQLVRITEPFKVAQRIYKVLLNHGEEGRFSLPEFNIT